jgi:hypothetical protein
MRESLLSQEKQLRSDQRANLNMWSILREPIDPPLIPGKRVSGKFNSGAANLLKM